jgi:hypothetical protein
MWAFLQIKKFIMCAQLKNGHVFYQNLPGYIGFSVKLQIYDFANMWGNYDITFTDMAFFLLPGAYAPFI